MWEDFECELNSAYATLGNVLQSQLNKLKSARMQYLGQRSSLLQALKVDNNLTIQLALSLIKRLVVLGICTICLLDEF